MASEHYTPVKPAANAQGQTADADDVNNVSNAVETAFESIEADIAAIDGDISAYTDKAQEWAEQDEDVNVTGEPAGSYSAKHYSIKSAASAATATAAASSAVDAENGALAAQAAAEAAETDAEAAAAEAEANADLLSVFTPNTQTGSYTLQLSDRDGVIIRMTTSSTGVLTVPPDVFSDNVLIPVVGAGSGLKSIAAGSGVTLNYPSGKNLNLRAQGSGVTLWLADVSGNEWDVVGDLERT